MFANLLAALIIGDAAPTVPPSYAISIEARLYHHENGTFSDNLLDQDGHFAGWNSAVLAAQGGTKFWDRGDVMVVINIRQNTEPAYNSPQGTAVIKAVVKGRTIASRKFTHINFNYANPYSLPLWLNDVGCAGRIEVTATVEGRTERAILDMLCGE